MKLIDKSALVAEIERRKLNHIDLTEFNSGYKNAIFDVLSFLDTLEVKEVDLDKEVNACLFSLDIDREERPETAEVVEIVAKHFFELGLKAKGE